MVSATHLGHELHESGLMDHDARVKRAQFIDKSTEIRETFAFASPVEILRAVKVFAGDLYGAMLWRLGGALAQQRRVSSRSDSSKARANSLELDWLSSARSFLSFEPFGSAQLNHL